MGVARFLTIAVSTIGLGMVGGSPALAGDPSSTATEGKKAGADPSRRVCRSVLPTGSRMRTRVCRTQAQWDASQDKTQDGILQHQMKESTTYRQDGGPF